PAAPPPPPPRARGGRRGGRGAGAPDNPAVFPTGCAGLITHCEQLPDGRYNIVLRGLYKFRIVEEDQSRSYRRASVETLAEPEDAEGLREARRRLERLLTGTGSNLKLPAGMDGADLVNALSQYLEFDPIEKQALLERNGPIDRCRALGDLLEMQSLAGGDFRQTPAQ
ncbi:MAG: hypothetical protein F4Y57_01890, partial [Acidobacteria bacterium]|nr:hypothetical protein [Acidobacteriota bacterium]